MTKGKGGIPDRWLEYRAIGDKIPGTRFVAFKVPLKPELCRSIEEADLWFTPAILMKQLPTLSAVIDLTNTARYYDSEVFVNEKILYTKIYCPGRVIPDRDVIQQFYKAVDKALEYCAKKNSRIGVHCTHGLNRTGHLVCKYMIERLHIPPSEAIELFEQARGYPMERRNYVQDLLETQPLVSSEQAEAERAMHDRRLSKRERNERVLSNYFATLQYSEEDNQSNANGGAAQNWRDRPADVREVSPNRFQRDERDQQRNCQSMGAIRKSDTRLHGARHDDHRDRHPYDRNIGQGMGAYSRNGYTRKDERQSAYDWNRRQLQGSFYPFDDEVPSGLRKCSRRDPTRGNVLYDPAYDDVPPVSSRFRQQGGARASSSAMDRSANPSTFLFPERVPNSGGMPFGDQNRPKQQRIRPEPKQPPTRNTPGAFGSEPGAKPKSKQGAKAKGRLEDSALVKYERSLVVSPTDTSGQREKGKKMSKQEIDGESTSRRKKKAKGNEARK